MEGRHRSISVELDNPRLGNTGHEISLASTGGFDRGSGKNGDIGGMGEQTLRLAKLGTGEIPGWGLRTRGTVGWDEDG